MQSRSYSDAQAQLLVDSVNRAIVTALKEAGHPLDVETLAARLAERNAGIVERTEYEDRLEQWKVTLHHSRLPKLADEGFIEYDRDDNTATIAEKHGVEWYESTDIADLVSYLLDDGEYGETGILTGQGSISEYGRQLTGDAEREVFCICTTVDFLTEECLQSAEDAVERGVEMAIGSHNPDIRDVIRTQLPDATVWEPQQDWLNTPVPPTMGRVLLVDRQRVMISLLDGDESGPDREDRAAIGDGADHPLVVMVRELLGSRLDHLDHQSEDFQKHLFG